MGLLPLDFESSAYTNFATPARSLNNKTFEPHYSQETKRQTFRIFSRIGIVTSDYTI